ncbi:MAG TPA: nucleotide pyrophosphohydrolase [Candidatus Nanoarchaeia archaeon]|nr:nucleotide pyrophosphohydrolase [Candidatus Nanoarchaeia archaeon]
MDKTTSVDNLKMKIKKFCEDRDWDQFHGAKDLAIGIITEAGELLENFRFKSEQETDEILHSDKRKEITEELSDVLFFVLRLAQRYDIDLSEELEKKLKKSSEKYPIGKAKGSNKKYDEL